MSKAKLASYEQVMYTVSMELLVKPKPNEAFYKLSAREASTVAMRVAKEYSADGKPDWQLFREFTRAWSSRNHGRRMAMI